jgi:hypothetical protein
MLVGVAVTAQPPLTPPATAPVPPTAPAVPPAAAPQPLPTLAAPPSTATPAGETPLAKFEPLTAFPPVTQYSVRAVLLGATWMGKRHQSHGRFAYAYNPALRQEMSGDNDIRQAQAALAMAQVAKFAGDPKQAAAASQAILTLLASTKAPANDPTCRVPVAVSVVCNRVGFAATLALAIYELPKPDDKLLDDAEKLCEFLHRCVRPDGSVHYTDGPNDVPPQIDPNGVNEYPGVALQALAASNRARPADWKRDAVSRGVSHYVGAFRSKPHPLLAATILPAAAEVYAQTKQPELAAAAFEMADWLCTLQIAPADSRSPQWAGGFRLPNAGIDPLPTPEAGLILQGLSCAYGLTRATVDLTREGRYRAATADAAQYLCASQFLESNTRHFDNAFRAAALIGGFHLSPTDGNLRIDATACAVSGLLRYLAVGSGQ